MQRTDGHRDRSPSLRPLHATLHLKSAAWETPGQITELGPPFLQLQTRNHNTRSQLLSTLKGTAHIQAAGQRLKRGPALQALFHSHPVTGKPQHLSFALSFQVLASH